MSFQWITCSCIQNFTNLQSAKDIFNYFNWKKGEEKKKNRRKKLFFRFPIFFFFVAIGWQGWTLLYQRIRKIDKPQYSYDNYLIKLYDWLNQLFRSGQTSRPQFFIYGLLYTLWLTLYYFCIYIMLNRIFMIYSMLAQNWNWSGPGIVVYQPQMSMLSRLFFLFRLSQFSADNIMKKYTPKIVAGSVCYAETTYKWLHAETINHTDQEQLKLGNTRQYIWIETDK